MTTFTKHSDQPLTYHFNFQEELGATYQVNSILFTPSILENSAQITLNLGKTSDSPSSLSYSFFQVMAELNGEENIIITVSTLDSNGETITHQESYTHVERPTPKNKW